MSQPLLARPPSTLTKGQIVQVVIAAMAGGGCLLLLPIWIFGVPGDGIHSDYARAWYVGFHLLIVLPSTLGALLLAGCIHCALVPAKRQSLIAEYVFFATFAVVAAALVMLAMVGKALF